MTTYEVTARIIVRVVEDAPPDSLDPQPGSPCPPAPAVSTDTLREELRSRALGGRGDADPATGCRTHRNKHGYVQLGTTSLRISHLVWEAHHGRPLPEGFIVWRTCRTEACAAEDHLEAGTPADHAEWQRQGWRTA